METESLVNVLGLDIGGANIKMSTADGNTLAFAFPMWKQPNQLTRTLQNSCSQLIRRPDIIALTTTAELADCFATKADGVRFVIDAVQEAFPGTPLRVWMTSGEFAEPEDARELTVLVAAANWHALATWAGRGVPSGPALLLDIGSTTTDVIPILDGLPAPKGLSDVERLQCGELVYTGVRRTPVCAMASSVPFRNHLCPLAAEVFATAADVYVLTGDLPEDSADHDTADQRPLTKSHSRNRLAHMLCCDSTEVSEHELQQVAEFLAQRQQAQILTAVDRVVGGLRLQSEVSRDIVPILSGSGAFLGRRLLSRAAQIAMADALDLPNMFHRPVAEAACAFAVARLAHDRCRDDLLQAIDF